MLEESNLNREGLVESVSTLLAEPSRLGRMGDAARKLSHPNAARDIAAMAARLAGIE
jgi:UDP-N-acetylglucosamine:LPS N-acetylglucosamine transferase